MARTNFLGVADPIEQVAGISAIIANYNVIAQPIANRVIGSITANITRAANPAGESALIQDPGFGCNVAA